MNWYKKVKIATTLKEAIYGIKNKINIEKNKTPYIGQKEKLEELYKRLESLTESKSEEDQRASIFEQPTDIYLKNREPVVNDEINELLDPDSVNESYWNSWYLDNDKK